jgi:probable phosphoglycerate mutase
MLTFLLIRHGENEYLVKNKLPGQLPGIHLNSRGQEQAENLADSLGNLPITAIYSSPLERAMETASPLARKLGLPIKQVPGLMDADVGKWANRSWKSLVRTKYWQVIQQTPSEFRFPGGESFVELQHRVIRELEELRSRHQEGLLAVFFHADSIKLALAHYLNMRLDDFQKWSISAGSITILKFDAHGVRVLGMNLNPPCPIIL